MTAKQWRSEHFFAGCWQVIGPDWQQCKGFMGMNEGQARLIAAAPDMLAALRALVNCADPNRDWAELKAARAAIAKAEGR